MAVDAGVTDRDGLDIPPTSTGPGNTVDLRAQRARADSLPQITGESDGAFTPLPAAAKQQAAAAAQAQSLSTEGVSENDPWVGKTLLGQFLITRKLGEGGFGATYLAEQAQLTRASKAVVKFIREDLPEQHRENVRQRFLREVVTLEKLDNHHLPKLLGSGQLGDQLFMVMQYGGDTTLTSLLKRAGPLPPDRAIGIAIQVCEALREAHRWSVVHRDVKPDNILLSSKNGEDWVKLIDVGIAKILDDSEIEDPNSQLSHARLVIGTPQFMSPEQAVGAPVDGRSDLYSLACVLFQLLTGRLPVRGMSSRELLVAHISQPAMTLKAAGASLPGFFQPLFDKALHKDPDKRFQTSKEMIAALDAARIRWESLNQPSRSRRFIHLAGALGLVALAVGAWSLTNHGGNEAESGAAATEGNGTASKTNRSARAPASNARSSEAPDGFAQFKGGILQMGRAPISGAAVTPDSPVHPVRVDPFALDKFETRVGDYAAFVKATGASRPIGPPGAETRFANLPVVNVTRIDAANYCAWKYPQGGRLPREEEWEWAARGGTPRMYPWGEVYRSDCVNALKGDEGHLENVDERACGATPEGIQGLIGNAWEWTSSDSSAYPESGFAAPKGLATIRGSSFFQDKPEELTATWRWFAPPSASRFIGFRCAWSNPDQAKSN